MNGEHQTRRAPPDAGATSPGPAGLGPRSVVSVGFCGAVYNGLPPFHPSRKYPESAFNEVSPVPNEPYDLLRRLLADLGWDSAHFGTASWNPLQRIIQPGQTVVIKPNLVNNVNRGAGDVFAVITHPSIVRAAVDYAFLALGGKGAIVIADAPIRDCQWAELMKATQLRSVQEFYRSRFGFDLRVVDLRDYELIDPNALPLLRNRRNLPGDPQGSLIVNLGRRSHFYGIDPQRFYGAAFDRRETIRHHQADIQEYSVSRSVLAANVLISIPKLKTHCKVGVTLNLKGLVGINTNKNFLVHHRRGCPSSGGDQYPEPEGRFTKLRLGVFARLADRALDRRGPLPAMYAAARAIYRHTIKPLLGAADPRLAAQDGGGWSGNDSAWRMVADLAKIIYFADARGNLTLSPQRRFLGIVDGIIGGEREGPLAPTAKPCGCLVCGEDLIATDLVAVRLMGYDARALRQFSVACDSTWSFPVRGQQDIGVKYGHSDVPSAAFFGPAFSVPFLFEPSVGWRGCVELSRSAASRLQSGS